MSKTIYFPSLRGSFGDWFYYPCLMKLKDISARVSLAEELQPSKKLNELIQRELKNERTKKIKDYIKNDKQRFFNSLIIAVYDGKPEWFELKDVSRIGTSEIVPEETVSRLGFLKFNGNEKLFALDGQHRLVGIAQAIKEKPALGEEELSVIFISHENTEQGLIRSRKLFTALNRNAKAVNKAEIIALDEDDAMAITVRRLILEDKRFSGDRIDFAGSANINSSNTQSFTTIVNLYDICTILFTEVLDFKKKDLITSRLSDKDLNELYALTLEYFNLLEKNFPEIKKYFSAKDTELAKIIQSYRIPNGGHILFRPLGLIIFTSIISKLSKNGVNLTVAIKKASKLPMTLAAAPYKGTIWLEGKKTINPKGKQIASKVLLFMLNQIEDENLTKDYQKFQNNPKAKLPAKI